jgi:hypothetical protein
VKANGHGHGHREPAKDCALFVVEEIVPGGIEVEVLV